MEDSNQGPNELLPYLNFTDEGLSDSSGPPSPSSSTWSKYIYNDTFQQLLDMEDSLEKFTKLSLLAEAFVTDAKHLGRTIIEERDIPFLEKTLKPQPLGGIAGGEKFIAHGILFKYCKDVKINDLWIYGVNGPNNEGAIKAGGLELKGINTFFSCGQKELCVPFVALVDFRGFRLSAISLLPISPETLLYGSANAGVNFKSEPIIHELMCKIGGKLNLKEHTVSDGQTKIIGPGDIEIHKSVLDGRYYVLDFARLMPPEPSSSKTLRTHLFFHLRPELVKSFPYQLCSDAFSRFLDVNERPQMNKEVEDAFQELHKKIRSLADKIRSSFDFAVGLTESPQNLCYELHQKGINLRYLGLLRSLIHRPEIVEECTLSPSRQQKSYIYLHRISLFFLQEMVARTMKCYINQKLRLIGTKMEHAEKPLEEITKVLNYIASPDKHKKFWQDDIKSLVIAKFGENSLTDQENMLNFPLCHLGKEKLLDPEELMGRLTFLCNWNIKSDVYCDFKKNHKKNKEFRFLPHDIEEMVPKVKYMGFIDYVAGRRELELVSSSNDFKRDATRLQFAVTKLQNALNKCHDNEEARNALIRAKLELLKLNWEPTKVLHISVFPWLLQFFTSHLKNDNITSLTPSYTLLFVEASILTSLSRNKTIHHRVETLLRSLDPEITTKWTTENFEGLWRVSKYSFQYFHEMLFCFSNILKNQGLLWSYVACCLSRVSVELVDVPPMVVKKMVESENVGEFVPELNRDLTQNEENSLCLCIDVILQLEKKFSHPAQKCGIQFGSWQYFAKKMFWYSYDRNSNKLIEEGYQEKMKTGSAPKILLGWTEGMNKVLANEGYEIDLENMKQVNRQSKIERDIRREARLKDMNYISWLAALWRTYLYLGLLLGRLGGGVGNVRLLDYRGKLEKLALNHFR